MLAPWLFIAVTGTTRWAHCRHYPAVTRQNGVQTRTCIDPEWEIACSGSIESGMIDTCLRYPFSWGITLIRHDKNILLHECRKSMGPEAYLDGSNGCLCFLPLDQHGRCRTSTEHCRTRFGSDAIADVAASDSGVLLVLASNEELRLQGDLPPEQKQYLVCRCADGRAFDETSQVCR